MCRVFVTICVLTIFTATAASAGLNPDAKAAVHVLAHDVSRSCSKNFPEIQWCEEIITTFGGCTDVDIFPVFFDLVEYQGIEYGITWPGFETCVFTSCSDLHIGQLVNSGDGISHAWYVCHTDEVVVAGWGWISAVDYGSICLVDHPAAGGMNVGACSGELDQVTASYCAGVCGQVGDSPCDIVYHPMNITKTDGLSGECVGPADSITYSISYDNLPNGADVHNVTITDFLPEEAEYVSASDGGTYVPAVHEVVWDLGTVPARGTGSVALILRVEEGIIPESVIENRCRIVSDETPATEAQEYSDVCPEEFAPLNIAKGDRLQGECVEAGATINYWIPYDNDMNPYAVHQIVLTDYLPGETEYISCTDDGIYDDAEHKVEWNLGRLGAGKGRSVDLLVRVVDGTSPGTTLSNMCVISSKETLPAEAVKTTDVCPEQYGPLGLVKSDGLGRHCVDPGDSVTYGITYSNSLNSAELHNVTLTDQLPDEVDYLSCSGGGVYDGVSTVTWYLGSLIGGVMDSVHLAVWVKPDVEPGQVILNTVQITSDETEPVAASDSTEICSLGFEHLRLTKTDIFGGSCVGAGGNIAYTIAYDNPNPDTVHDVNMIDYLPTQTSFVSATGGSYDSDDHTVSWYLGNLAGYSGGGVELTVGVFPSVPAGTNIDNSCEISGTETGATTVHRITSVCGTPTNPIGKVAVHVELHASRTCSKNFPTITNCGDIQYTIPYHDVDAFPVFFDIVEYQGFDYSLAWPGTYTCAFISCSDLTIGTISNPGDGISHAWYTCQAGHVALPGWGWIYEPGPAQICVVPHPEAGGINIGDCSGMIGGPLEISCAGIAGAYGDDPCTPTGVQSTTWGNIKAMFR